MLLRKMLARKWRIFCFLLPLLFCVELQADIWPAVLVGQPAPGIAGARFISLGTPAVNASGDIAFSAGVAVGGVQGDGNTNVQSDQNVSGIALFGFFDGSGKFINEVGAPSTVPLRSMSVFVQAGTSTSTGVALANPNAASASVTLILRDSNSNELGRMPVTIPVMATSRSMWESYFQALLWDNLRENSR